MVVLQKVTYITSAMALAAGQMLSAAAVLVVVALATASDAAACSDNAYIGTVCFTAAPFCPPKYLVADGRSFAPGAYQKLYTVIGNIYGGTAPASFSLPDLKARSPIGVGQGTDAGVTQPVKLGQKAGLQALTMASNQVAPHGHQADLLLNFENRPVKIDATPGTLGVSATLTGKSTNGSNALVDGSYLAHGATGINSAPIYVADPPSTVDDVALKGVSAALTGAPGSPEINFNYSVPTSGSVTVGPNQSSATPIPTQSPGIGLTACIAYDGLVPQN